MDGYAGAAAGERLHDGPADPPAPTRDERNLPVEIHQRRCGKLISAPGEPRAENTTCPSW